MHRPLNPFAPSQPIPPGQFVGRHSEIRELEAALAHAKRGRPRHFLMTGDRGVGKTSFLDYIRKRATGKIHGVNFRFLVVDFAINKNTTSLDFAKTLESEMNAILSEQAPIKEMMSKAWSFIRKIEAAGFAYKQGEEKQDNRREIYLEIADSLCKVVETVCGISEDNIDGYSQYDGILILIDEVDQSSKELDLGALLKYMLERLNRKECTRVALGLAGLNSSTQILLDSHPSSLRIFDELPLGNLRAEDVDELISSAELQVKNDGFDEFSFTDSAKKAIYELSGGHPHFVHQFGYCAFENWCESGMTNAEPIDEKHVIQGAFSNRGALDVIGDVYFRKIYSELLSNPHIIAILQFLSEDPRGKFTKDEIKEYTKIQKNNIEISLNKLIESTLIASSEGFGTYWIRHPCFAYWIKAN